MMTTFWNNPDNKFLSNFYEVSLDIDGKQWPSVEHYYQAMKSNDPLVQEEIRILSTPGKAKRRGQKITVRPNWAFLKFNFMLKALLKKFSQEPLKSKLLSTEGLIIEDSPKDLIWGSGVIGGLGPGQNMLGKLLMITRSFYKQELSFPLNFYIEKDIPEKDHVGSFSSVRKHDIHTGIDLYTNKDEEVLSMADGIVEAISDFTGEAAGTPWWENTKAVVINHEFGFVLYGEITPEVNLGDFVKKGQIIGKVSTVLKKDKGRPMNMLHLEWYKTPVADGVFWTDISNPPASLLDPTELLKLAKEKL